MRPPSVATPVTGTATGSGGNSGYISSISGSSGSRRDTSSTHQSPIQSFPPTHPPHMVVPSTNSNRPVSQPASASNSASTPSTSTSGYPPSSFGNGNVIPSSFAHRKPPTSSNPTTSAYSSPLPPQGVAIPSHVSSTELSSNRPLFSSTQGSAIPGSEPRQDEWSRLPPVVRTYGKTNLDSTPTPVNNRDTTSNREMAEQIVLSSSPISEPSVLSPAKRRSASPIKKRTQIVIADDDDETEEEEYVEMRTPAAVTVPTPKQGPPISKVQVVLPRSRPSSANQSRNDTLETPITDNKLKRHVSPDPLDLLAPSLRTPAKSNAPASRNGGQPSSSAVSGSSRAGSVAPSWSGADGSSRRASSRQADNKAKAEQEKEERRRKRREENQRKALEEQDKLAKKSAQDKGKGKEQLSPIKVTLARRRAPSPPSAEGVVEVEESVIEIPPPPQPSATTVRSSRKRKSDVVELQDDDRGKGDGDFNPAEDGKSKGKAKAPVKKGKKVTPKKGKGKKEESKAVMEPEPEEEIIAQPEPEQESASVIEFEMPEKAVEEDEVEQEKEIPKEPTSPPPPKSVSPARPPLRATSSNISTPSTHSAIHRPSPGPTKPNGTAMAPGGIKWKAPRADLSAVLAKFGGAKRSGMSKRLKIAPLHQKIGPGVKALPPPPKKPEKKKAADDDDDDEDNEDNWEEDEDGNRVRKAKDGKKSMEWFMVED
ncbi:hypothetical protein I317_07238 [Kwoniella heveanensis CBS 569]|nr:hypothetical protein I317_07238 [Kwoniella heveanensis CBS 569]